VNWSRFVLLISTLLAHSTDGSHRGVSLIFIKNEIVCLFKKSLILFLESSQDLEFGGVGLFGRLAPKDSAKARMTLNHVTPEWVLLLVISLSYKSADGNIHSNFLLLQNSAENYHFTQDLSSIKFTVQLK
jgi:hypothetical protein